MKHAITELFNTSCNFNAESLNNIYLVHERLEFILITVLFDMYNLYTYCDCDATTNVRKLEVYT